MAFIIRLLVFCLVVVAIVFAVSNDVPANFTLWPFGYNLTMPLYVPTLAAFLIGAMLGGTIVALRLFKIRLQLFKAKRTIKSLQKSIDQTNQQMPILDAKEASGTVSQATNQLQTTTQQQPTITPLPY